MAFEPLFVPSTRLTPEPAVVVSLVQYLAEPTILLPLVDEFTPTNKSYLSTVKPGSPACKAGKSTRLPLLNFKIGAGIFLYYSPRVLRL